MSDRNASWLTGTLVLVLAGAPGAGCGDDDASESASCTDDNCDGGVGAELAQTFYVAHQGSLVSYDLESGEERPGALQDIDGPVDLQALSDGTLLVNLTNSNEILVFDGTTMLEIERMPSSGADGARPVHSFITPVRDGAQYWMTLNDGMDGVPESNTAVFLDLTQGDSRFERVGEVQLGVGHHKASFSATQERVVISNIGDCDNVLSVYDYSDPSDIQTLATLDAEAAGFGAADPGDGNFDPSFCDPTYERGLPPAPHGCATASESGKAYCNLTSSGAIVVIDIDADEPEFSLVETSGQGGGFTFVHPGGRYVYSLQEEPREGADGESCQIGQLVVLDATSDEVVSTTPLFYTGADCSEMLAGTAAETANPGHAYFTRDGDKLYVPTSGGFMVADARVDQLLVLDTSDPAAPVQGDSIEVGEHTDHSAGALSGDGRHLLVVNSVDGTISDVDTQTDEVIATFEVESEPRVVATFGSAPGPSVQTGPIVSE